MLGTREEKGRQEESVETPGCGSASSLDTALPHESCMTRDDR